MKNQYCTVGTIQKKKCKNKVYLIFKVKVFHLRSGRKTWQTWALCKKHFDQFHQEQGQGWASTYKNKEDAPVIGYKIPMIKGFIETPHKNKDDNFFAFHIPSKKIIETNNNLLKLKEKYCQNYDIRIFTSNPVELIKD